MLSQLTVFFISIVVRINLSSQEMLQLHVQCIMSWVWFVKNVKHPEVQEQHTKPGSPTRMCHRSGGRTQEISIGNTEGNSSPINQLPNNKLLTVKGRNMNEIIDFCCCCALTLTVGPRRGGSRAWPCYWPFFGVPLQFSASLWHQARAVSAQQLCKLGISHFFCVAFIG